MKQQKYYFYESPKVDIITIEIESGFATSFGSYGENGVWDGLN